jgi:hypothetical protein
MILNGLAYVVHFKWSILKPTKKLKTFDEGLNNKNIYSHFLNVPNYTNQQVL